MAITIRNIALDCYTLITKGSIQSLYILQVMKSYCQGIERKYKVRQLQTANSKYQLHTKFLQKNEQVCTEKT